MNSHSFTLVESISLSGSLLVSEVLQKTLLFPVAVLTDACSSPFMPVSHR